MTSTARFATITVPLILFLSCGGGPKQPFTPEPVASIEDGEALIENSHFEEAATMFEDILKTQPEDPKAHYYLGYCKSALGDNATAASEYRLAIQYDNTLLVAHNNLGLLLLDDGKLEEAQSELKTVLDQSENDGDAHFNYGLVLEALGKKDLAKSEYEKAATLNPEDPYPLLAIGDMAKSNGKKQEALSKYKEARKRNPEDPIPLVSVGQMLIELDQIDEGVDILLQLKDFADADAFLLTSAGRLLTKQKKDKEAILLYKSAIVKDESFARVHIMLGNALARTGNFTEAILHFEKYIEMAPNSPEAATAQKGIDVCKAKDKK